MAKKSFDDVIDGNTHADAEGAIKGIISAPAETEATAENINGINVEHLQANIVKVQMLTAKDVERITGLSDKTTAKYLREGKIKAVKHGLSWVIHPDDLNAYLAGRFDYEWMERCKAAEEARKARRKPRTAKPADVGA
jgi:hypothetical protein